MFELKQVIVWQVRNVYSIVQSVWPFSPRYQLSCLVVVFILLLYPINEPINLFKHCWIQAKSNADKHPVNGWTISTSSSPHISPHPLQPHKKKSVEQLLNYSRSGGYGNIEFYFKLIFLLKMFFPCGCHCVPVGCSPSHPSTEVTCSCLNEMIQKLFTGHDVRDRKPDAGFLV